MKYELTFWGTVPGFTRYFDSLAAAQDEAYQIHRNLEDDGTRAAHPAMIYGPDLDRNGLVIN